MRVVVGEEHDTSNSSYLLNLFTHDGSENAQGDGVSVYIDIDAARAGNEARFLNDYHGAASAPNAQFWPYFDTTSGEKRMAVKTIQDIAPGAEIMVDYGGRYFAKDSSDDSDMQSSDEEFAPKKQRRIDRASRRHFRKSSKPAA